MSRAPAYERDAYLRRLDVEIVETGAFEGRDFAILDDTVCFPEGGGQPADHGRLGEVAILDAQKIDGAVRHFLEAPVETGPSVLELDWKRRYDHMQQHTAQHLLTAIALDRFGWATRSFHLGPQTSDIELDAAELSPGDLEALEAAVAPEIAAGRPITTRRVSTADYDKLEVRSRGLPDGHTGDIRLVEIEGIDRNTCGGTHLASTAQIETIKIVGTEKLRGGTRVRWVAGGRARRRFEAHEARNAALREVLDSSDEDLVETARLKLEQLKEARRRARHLEEQLAEARVQILAGSEDPVIIEHFDAGDATLLQRTGRSLLERAPNKAALLTAGSGRSLFFLVACGPGSGVEAAMVGPRIAELLEGRGGGSGGIFQGKSGSLERLEEAQAALALHVARTQL